MEQHDPTRRQFALSPYGVQQQQQHQASNEQQATAGGQTQAQFSYSESAERYRQSSLLQQSPATPAAAAAARAGSHAQQVYGFAEGPQQYAAMPPVSSNPMPYAQGPQTPEQRQPQYPQYGAGVVYGMGQPSTPQATQSPYEQISQYRHRPSTEPFGAQFAVPQTPEYYVAGQAGPTGAPVSEFVGQAGAQHIQPQFPQAGYQQPGPVAHPAYPSNMIDPSQTAAYSVYGQPQQYTAQASVQPVDQNFNAYQAQVRNIFTNARDGILANTHVALLEISNYLLANVEALGLTRDEESMHDDRIRLWDEFNRAWLTTLQRQFDMTHEMMRTRQALREPQSLMNVQVLEHLSRELVRLCDGIEKHGLVDYQMGVAEEEIVDLILRCLTLLDPNTERDRDTAPGAESSSSRNR